MDKKKAAFWLASVPGIGQAKCRALLAVFHSPQAVYEADTAALEKVDKLRPKDIRSIALSKNPEEIEQAWEKCQKQKIHFVWQGEKEYPTKLRQIYDAPFGLFYKGSLPAEDRPVLAVVGARNASYKSCQLAYRMGKELAENGVAVVSGLARGIDIGAQKGVLSVAVGKTYGVMGCGIDICYPREHIEPYTLMQRHGGIVSEYPPGVAPRPGNFPMRNRLISAFSDGILVIEAGRGSGSLITAEVGLEQGKDIFVVPGGVFDRSFEGSNQLIQNGAALVTKTKDILDGLGLFLDEDVSERKKKSEFCLATTEKTLYDRLSLEPIHLSEIAEISGFPVQKAIEILLSLEMKGVVKNIGNHYFALRLD